MSITNRGRRRGYDNVASGSAYGRELLIAGSTVSVQIMIGGGRYTSTSTAEADHSNISAGTSVSEQLLRDNIAAGSTVGDENMG